MQVVDSLFTFNESRPKRTVTEDIQISWKRESNLGIKTFTIGVSTIGGIDIIGINPGSIGSPGIYSYFNETPYLLGLAWERGLNMPTGGLSMGMAEATLDNTSGRFTPRYMGGQSELFTSILPRRPFKISAGFGNISIPQFSGILDRQPEVDIKGSQVKIHGSDYNGYFANRFLDQELIFTGKRTDEVMETLFDTLGAATSQYELDYGINLIPFGWFEKGTRYQDIFHQLAEAENGHFYQDEEGVFKFENRQHWDYSPFNEVQRVIHTAQVLEAGVPSDDHLINVVEINSKVLEKQPLQTIFNLPTLSGIRIPANDDLEQFFEFQDPVLALTEPTNGGADSYYIGNSNEDGSGTDLTSKLTFKNLGTFAKSVKYKIHNSHTADVFLTQLVLSGRIAKNVSDLYYREQDDSSVTAYDEHVLTINNDYIQNASWAASYARMILNDFSDIENLQTITILAKPELQLGDLISWQGRYWRIFDIKSTLNASVGFVQELTLLQRTINTYFRIGISTIGGSDKIAP